MAALAEPKARHRSGTPGWRARAELYEQKLAAARAAWAARQATKAPQA